MEYGLQLYSIRDVGGKSFEESLKVAAELGYDAVETAGFGGCSAQEVKELLDKYGLKLWSTHSGYPELMENYNETIAFHKAIGNKNYIIPGYMMTCQADIDAFVENVNILCDKMAAEGITLGYHNHHWEFIPNADGTVVYEQLLCRTKLKFEIDTYWAFVGMKNPVLLLERVKDRLFFIHIKDGSPDGNGTPLGKGEAPVADVYNWAKAHNIPMVVESETCTPDGPTEAKICIDYLHSLEKE
ncbi:MAG: sugar phosphate isomerase/epimerase [Clostridia bacterium]|nr:sugar phosphate isomerase/epimerase [Clostridia bacterium]